MRSASHRREALAAVGRGDERQVRLVELVLVLRVDDEAGEVERAPDHELAAVEGLPGRAAVVGAVEPVLRNRGLDQGVDDVGFSGRHGHSDAAPGLGREALRALLVEIRPRRAAVGRLQEAARARRVGAVAAGAERPALAAEVPHAGEERARVLPVHGDHGAARREVAAFQDLRPRLAAVGGAVDAAVVAVGPELAGRARVNGVGFRGIHEDLRDPLRAAEPRVRPALAAVDRLVHAVADRDAVARPGFARADPDRLRVLRIDRHRADRLHGLLVEDRLEGRSAVDRLPDAAGGGADEDRQAVALADGVDGGDAAAHRRGADVARAEAGDGLRVDLDRRRGLRRAGRQGRAEDSRRDSDPHACLHRAPHLPTAGAAGWWKSCSFIGRFASIFW